MRDIGRIVRLQIQRASLKTGEKPTRVYDPAPLLVVDRLALGPDGALGEGSDGSWLVLDLRGGRIVGVEVALWPDVHRNPALAAPAALENAAIVVPVRAGSGPAPATLEVEAPMRAEADDAERVVYFRIGDRREVRSVRLGSDLLVDVDRQDRLAGLWLLNVPPFPAPTPP